jgi:hypothetical protein
LLKAQFPVAGHIRRDGKRYAVSQDLLIVLVLTDDDGSTADSSRLPRFSRCQRILFVEVGSDRRTFGLSLEFD